MRSQRQRLIPRPEPALPQEAGVGFHSGIPLAAPSSPPGSSFLPCPPCSVAEEAPRGSPVPAGFVGHRAPSRKCPAPRQRAGQAGEGDAEGLGAVQAPTVLRSHRLLRGGQGRCRCEGRSPGEALPEGGRDKPQGATSTRQVRACSVQHGLGLALLLFPILALFLCPAPAPGPAPAAAPGPAARRVPGGGCEGCSPSRCQPRFQPWRRSRGELWPRSMTQGLQPQRGEGFALPPPTKLPGSALAPAQGCLCGALDKDFSLLPPGTAQPRAPNPPQ